jgi:hypothetical protein
VIGRGRDLARFIDAGLGGDIDRDAGTRARPVFQDVE